MLQHSLVRHHADTSERDSREYNHSHSWPTCSWHPSVVLCDTECLHTLHNMEMSWPSTSRVMARTHFAQHGDVLAYMQLAPLCEYMHFGIPPCHVMPQHVSHNMHSHSHNMSHNMHSHNILRGTMRHHARHTWHTSRIQVLHASCRNTCHTTCTCTCTWYTTWHTMLHTCTRAREDTCTQHVTQHALTQHLARHHATSRETHLAHIEDTGTSHALAL